MKAQKNSSKQKKRIRPGISLMMILIAAIAVIIFCLAGYRLLTATNAYNEASDAYDDIRNLFIDKSRISSETRRPSSIDPSAESDPDDLNDGFVWDYSKLLAINPDAIGYIRMRGDGDNIIDYPVVQGNDNSYYLNVMFDLTPNQAGAIFMDADSTDGFDSRYAIIYGHNMRSGARMFSCLKNYRDPEYFAKHSEVDVYAGEKHYVYKVFSQFTADVYGFIYNDIFPDDAEFMSIIDQALAASAFDAGIPRDYFNTGSKVLVLSTCLDDYSSDYRYVVLLVRDREVKDH